MIPSTVSDRAATRFFALSAALLLAGYLILGWIGCRAGIGSLDANGIIHVVNDRLQTGTVEVSRPPGHPANEYWVLPSVVRVLALGAVPILSPRAYGLYQLTGGVVCLVFFWLLLGEFSVSGPRRLLATACLAFSPQFLITSSDGEEFLWGMAWVLAAFLVLAKLWRGAIQPAALGWGLSIVGGVVASGYRIEYGGVALLVLFASLFMSDQSLRLKGILAGMAGVLLVLLWSPVLIHHGVAQPYPNPLSFKTRLSIGLYKIVFHAMGIIPLAVALIFLWQARPAFRLRPSARLDILNDGALALVLIFFALFFLYPTKILVVLPGVAFLILLGAVHAGRWTWICFVTACLSVQLAHLDCFADRHWTGLKFQPSLWAQNLAEKPSALGLEAAAAARLASTGRHVVVANLWPWALAWQKTHAGWPGVPEPENENTESTESYAVGPGIVASRSILANQPLLEAYARQGYEIWIDQDLYREMYMRYDLDAPTPVSAQVGGLNCRIVVVQ